MPREAWLRLAEEAGANAVALYFAALLAVLLATALLGWAVRTQWQPLTRSRLPRPGRVLLNALAGFTIVVLGAAAFAEIAEQLAPGRGMAVVDDALTASIRQHTSPLAMSAFATVTHLGDALTLAVLGVLVTLLLWWKRHRALAAGWVAAVAGNALLNPLLKRIFERVRPLHEHGLVSETSYSFPSGHSSSSLVAYGMLAYLALRLLPPRWHLPALLAAAGLAFSIGCSRIFLQVHFASDVAAGFASGGAWLLTCIVSVELGRAWQGRR